MKDILKEIKDATESGSVMEKGGYFRKETMVSGVYFINEVLNRYPNLEFIRIFMNETTFIPTFHESLRDEKYYLYSVFIDSNILEYLASDLTIREINGDRVIDLSNYRWKKQIELRNKLFDMSSIIMALCDEYLDDIDYGYKGFNMSLSKDISIFPFDFNVSGYEFLNKSHFVLISNSKFINQEEIDNFCLLLIDKLDKNNQSVISQEIAIYESIIRKLKRNRVLTSLEKEVLENFINGEIRRVISKNTLLVRSKSLVVNPLIGSDK